MNRDFGEKLDCSSFLDGYSDYRDGLLDIDARAEFMAHMAECDSCHRYDRVLSRGVELLAEAMIESRGTGPALVTVQRNAAESEQAEASAMSPLGSGLTAAAAIGVAAVLALVAWSPALFNGSVAAGNFVPEMELAPVLAAAPALAVRSRPFSIPAGLPIRNSTDELDDLARSMLFQYGGVRPAIRNAVATPELE